MTEGWIIEMTSMFQSGMMQEQQQPGIPNVQVAQKEFSARFFLLKLAMLLAFVLVALRLVQVQIVDAGKFQTIARKQYEQRFTLPAVRGNIYDRYGNVLASNTMYVSFAADPKILGNNVKKVAEKFARVFGRPESYYLSKLRSASGGKSNKRFVWLERHVKPSVARELESTRLEGIVIVNEPKRLYHYGELAGQLIGFTDIDNNGISGMEMHFDEEMSGVDGSVVMQRDGLGRARRSADYPQVDPVNGKHLMLTIDLAYQSIVEEELKRGIALNKADAGLAVMLNPKTGEILAMANVPGVDLNQYTEYDLSAMKNRAVTDMFEPGSVFKVVIASAAYEYQLIAPDKVYNAEHGEWKIKLPGGKYRLIRDSHESEVLTFQEAIEFSSNIVMAKASPTIGAERFYRQARDYGFGIPTGVDMPGEVRGRLKKPHEWSGTSLQSMSYGYEVAVTPLQIAAAYAAVANKGVLMKPYILSQIKTEDGEVVEERQSQVIRRVVSEQTTMMLTEAFEGVVEHGSAQDVRIEGMRIAGKTGTSRKIIDGKYALGNYTSSFVGYFPADDPQVVCLVMMDNPRTRGYYGGITSGPVFRAIAERIINTTSRFEQTPEGQPDESKLAGVTLPDVRNLKLGIAQKILEGQGLTVDPFGEGDIVVRQSPEPGKRVEHGESVKLVLTGEPEADKNGMMTVPDVRGMSIRRAVNRLTVDEFEVRVEGSGVVAQQYPFAGQKVRIGSAVRVVCEPKTIASTVLY